MNSPSEIARNYVSIGAGKTRLPIGKMFVLGIFAGIFIAMGGIGASTASATIASPSVAKLVGACIFPAGLTMVLIAGSELFTGNTLIVISVLEKATTWRAMFKNWVVVFIGNFIGAVFVGAAVAYGHTLSLFGNELARAAIDTATIKTSLTFTDAFIRGILCNMLVCLAVWIAFGAKSVTGKILGLFFPIMVFVLCGFEHSIADMYFVSAGLFAINNPIYLAAASLDTSGLTWAAFMIKNLLPVTLGNIVGGSIIIGLGYWYVYLWKSKKEQ